MLSSVSGNFKRQRRLREHMKQKIIHIFFTIFSTITYGQEKNSIYTIDIENFYTSYDLAIKDTVNALKIFEENYFEKGTKGLNDFYKFKIKDKGKFVEKVLEGKAFYSSIRQELSKVNIYEDTIKNNFIKFNELYPKAKFGNLYFVVGRLNSNGTISKNGLIIGTELLSKTNENSNFWNKKLQNWVLEFNHIPITVFHEMIHFNQKGMKEENNLLSYSLREGSAEFLTELFTGKTDGNYSKFIGRELIIWKDFKKEMNLNVFDSWRDENEPLRPRNALYWTGYLICKSYYENSEDKKQAIYDILNIKNNSDFYIKSKVEEYLTKNYR